ncbi:MAG TPA: DUF4870 domain-containing protein [Rubrobacter sp.]|nr:DUF4870 domain-containing protein [Rubrobacter sp.]
MEAKEHNYGVVGEQEAATMSARDERTWSALAHLSIFLNLVTGFLGPVAALIVWLVYRDRSSKVAFQALQAMWYQVAWLVVLVAGWTVTGILTIVLIGFLLMPAMALISLVPFVHGAYAAYRVNRDGEYRYPFIADMIERR